MEINGVLALDAHRYFKTKPSLLLFSQANWDPARISDDHIHANSMLAMFRLSQTKQMADPTTGKKRLKETKFLKRLKDEGCMKEDRLLELPSFLKERMGTEIHETRMQKPLASLPQEMRRAPETQGTLNENGKIHDNDQKDHQLSSPEVLDLLKWDIIQDVCGSETYPVLSLNLVWITARFMTFFSTLEKKLEQVRNPIWVQAYERDKSLSADKRIALMVLSFTWENEECMQIMAQEMRSPPAEFKEHAY